MPLPPDEDIVRAVCTDKWDGERLSPSLFVGERISVSRLAVIPLADHWDLFREYVQQPPERLLGLIARILPELRLHRPPGAGDHDSA
jgi:hypothetical protein